MYSKFLSHATCAAALVFAACTTLPWRNEPIGNEINVAFVMKNNLPFVSSVTINDHQGSFLIGCATPRSVIDNGFAHAAGRDSYTLQLNERRSVSLRPLFADLHGVADAIIGANVWGAHAVTLDYHAGLLTFQREGIHPELMHVFRYDDAPMINVVIDGRTIPAIVDTTSPDTLVLPLTAGAEGRHSANVQIAGSDFGAVDVAVRDVAVARVGNRLLSRFLVTVDYGKREVGLWRDPRMALPQPSDALADLE